MHKSEFDEAMQATSRLHDVLVKECIVALKEILTADLSDKKTLIRIILCDFSSVDTLQDDCIVTYWVDKADYVDETTFNLYLTQAKKIEKEELIPRRMEVKQRITIRQGGLFQAPTISVTSLFTLRRKLMALAFPDEYSQEILSEFFSEDDFIGTLRYFRAMYHALSGRIHGREHEEKTIVN